MQQPQQTTAEGAGATSSKTLPTAPPATPGTPQPARTTTILRVRTHTAPAKAPGKKEIYPPPTLTPPGQKATPPTQETPGQLRAKIAAGAQQKNKSRWSHATVAACVHCAGELPFAIAHAVLRLPSPLPHPTPSGTSSSGFFPSVKAVQVRAPLSLPPSLPLSLRLNVT